MPPAVERVPGTGSAGLTFVDLLVAMTVLVIVAVPLVTLFTAGYAAIARAGQRTAAVNLCREKIEAVKAGGFDRCLESTGGGPGGLYTETEAAPGGSEYFRRETELELVEIQLEDNAAVAQVIAITVRVAWGDPERECAVVLTSYLAGR